MTTLIAFLSTRWIKRAKANATRGALAGGSTVFFSALIGMLIFYFLMGSVLPLTDLLIMTVVSIAFIPIGTIAGAVIYGIRQKQ